MRVCLALGLVLLMVVRLLPVAAATPIVEVAASRGDIRSGPGATHEIMGEVRQGEKYAALERRGEWYRIRLVDGREGWIHEKLVAVARSGEASEPRAAASGASIGAGNFYRSRWAVVVGINDYRTWPPLNYAVNDAKSVRSKLLGLGFESGNIFERHVDCCRPWSQWGGVSRSRVCDDDATPRTTDLQAGDWLGTARSIARALSPTTLMVERKVSGKMVLTFHAAKKRLEG